MRQSQAIATVALIAAFAAFLTPAMADGWRHWGASPRLYAKEVNRGGIRYYNGAIRYYNNGCPYGDCACLRNRALATRNPVWWDRYQACTG